MAYETRTTTIGQILLMPPSTPENKAWVDGFEATVRNSKAIKARNGSVFYTGIFCDPQDERYQIKGTCNIDITRLEGMMVEVGGQGISKESYKGTDEIKIGQKATIVPVANQQQQLPVQSAPPPPPPPPQQHYQQPPPPQPVQPSQAPARKPFGPAIGNCIALAVKCVLHQPDLIPGTVDFQREVYQIASDLLRLNEHMEIGHLARSAKDREAGVEEQVPAQFQAPPLPPPPPQAQPPPVAPPPPRPSFQPGPQPAFHPDDSIGIDEDAIPFN